MDQLTQTLIQHLQPPYASLPPRLLHGVNLPALLQDEHSMMEALNVLELLTLVVRRSDTSDREGKVDKEDREDREDGEDGEDGGVGKRVSRILEGLVRNGLVSTLLTLYEASTTSSKSSIQKDMIILIITLLRPYTPSKYFLPLLRTLCGTLDDLRLVCVYIDSMSNEVELDGLNGIYKEEEGKAYQSEAVKGCCQLAVVLKSGKFAKEWSRSYANEASIYHFLLVDMKKGSDVEQDLEEYVNGVVQVYVVQYVKMFKPIFRPLLIQSQDLSQSQVELTAFESLLLVIAKYHKSNGKEWFRDVELVGFVKTASDVFTGRFIVAFLGFVGALGGQDVVSCDLLYLLMNEGLSKINFSTFFQTLGYYIERVSSEEILGPLESELILSFLSVVRIVVRSSHIGRRGMIMSEDMRVMERLFGILVLCVPIELKVGVLQTLREMVVGDGVSVRSYVWNGIEVGGVLEGVCGCRDEGLVSEFVGLLAGLYLERVGGDTRVYLEYVISMFKSLSHTQVRLQENCLLVFKNTLVNVTYDMLTIREEAGYMTLVSLLSDTKVMKQLLSLDISLGLLEVFEELLEVSQDFISVVVPRLVDFGVNLSLVSGHDLVFSSPEFINRVANVSSSDIKLKEKSFRVLLLLMRKASLSLILINNEEFIQGVRLMIESGDVVEGLFELLLSSPSLSKAVLDGCSDYFNWLSRCEGLHLDMSLSIYLTFLSNSTLHTDTTLKTDTTDRHTKILLLLLEKVGQFEYKSHIEVYTLSTLLKLLTLELHTSYQHSTPNRGLLKAFLHTDILDSIHSSLNYTKSISDATILESESILESLNDCRNLMYVDFHKNKLYNSLLIRQSLQASHDEGHLSQIMASVELKNHRHQYDSAMFEVVGSLSKLLRLVLKEYHTGSLQPLVSRLMAWRKVEETAVSQLALAFAASNSNVSQSIEKSRNVSQSIEKSQSIKKSQRIEKSPKSIEKSIKSIEKSPKSKDSISVSQIEEIELYIREASQSSVRGNYYATLLQYRQVNVSPFTTEMICKDALESAAIWQTVSYTLLNSLVKGQSMKVIQLMTVKGYLNTFVGDLKTEDKVLVKGVLEGGMGTLKYVVEMKLNLLVQVAAASPQSLLDCGLLQTIQGMDLLSLDSSDGAFLDLIALVLRLVVLLFNASLAKHPILSSKLAHLLSHATLQCLLVRIFTYTPDPLMTSTITNLLKTTLKRSTSLSLYLIEACVNYLHQHSQSIEKSLLTSLSTKISTIDHSKLKPNSTAKVLARLKEMVDEMGKKKEE